MVKTKMNWKYIAVGTYATLTTMIQLNLLTRVAQLEYQQSTVDSDIRAAIQRLSEDVYQLRKPAYQQTWGNFE